MHTPAPVMVRITRGDEVLAFVPAEQVDFSCHGLRRATAALIPRSEWRAMIRGNSAGQISHVYGREGRTLGYHYVGDALPVKFEADGQRRDGVWVPA